MVYSWKYPARLSLTRHGTQRSRACPPPFPRLFVLRAARTPTRLLWWKKKFEKTQKNKREEVGVEPGTFPMGAARSTACAKVKMGKVQKSVFFGYFPITCMSTRGLTVPRSSKSCSPTLICPERVSPPSQHVPISCTVHD